MINKIILFSIRNKFVIGLMVLALIGAGIWSMFTIKLGSVPDITNNQVQVITTAPNLGTEDIEQFVTYPVELAMANLPDVVELRSVSRFGLSVVTIVFDDEVGTYLPRQLVQEKLASVREEIPEGFGKPFMAPITTGLGEIYQYSLHVEEGYEDQFDATELRTLQDWLVKRQMALVLGVVEVNAFGGYVKQYEVALDPNKLNSFGISMHQVFEALEQNNANTGGAYIERNHQANFIRGEGLANSLEDLENTVVANQGGTPILIKDLAEKVGFGSQIRYGAFTQDGKEGVGGQVLMLKGESPSEVVENVQKRMKEIQKSLPEGVTIAPFLDRSSLIARTTGTIEKNLLEGSLIVIFVLVILLGSLRGGLITASVIPLSLLFAFILMREFGIWANLMSLGAIDFGIIVDGAVIIVEGMVYEIRKHTKKHAGVVSQKEMDKIAYKSASTMMNSAFFGQLIILIVFTPILFLTGVEGKTFRPMAFTFGFAILGALLLCLTYVPMIASLTLRPTRKKNWFTKIENAVEGFSGKIMSGVQKVYRPLLSKSLKFKKTVILGAVLLFAIAAFVFSRMGGEFIPQLDEGDIAMQILVKPGSALSESITISKKAQNLINEIPEVKTVVSRIGVAEIPTDPMPMDIADSYIILEKDKSKWTSAETKEGLIAEIKEKIAVIPGANFVFSQPLELKFNELLTGVREDIAIKLYGEDLEVLSKRIQEIAAVVKTVPGAADLSVEATAGLPQMTVTYNRSNMAKYGLTISKLNNYVSAAFAGKEVSVIFEGEKRFAVVVRLAEKYRKSIDNLKNLYVDLPDGTQIPLKEVADIDYKMGPMQISRDNTYRRVSIGVNVRGRDVKSMVEEIQQKLETQVDLPTGYYVTYGGSFENLQRATDRLLIVVPIALALIFILLYFALSSISQALMIYIAVPLATIGGVFALWIRGMPFSISAGVGFIVLFGVAVLNGLVLINKLNELKKEGRLTLRERIFHATQERLRPILLTATAAIMGFIPMAISTSGGAEVQRPLATVVIGGLISATLLTLVVIPILYYGLENRKRSKRKKTLPKAGLTVLLLLFSWIGNAQEIPSKQQLTLGQAKEMALENYPSLKASEAMIEQQKALKGTSFDMGTTQVFTGKEEVGHNLPGVQTSIGFQQQNIAVFSGFSKSKYYNEQIKLGKQHYAVNKQELLRQVLLAWNQIEFNQAKLAFTLRLDSLYTDFKKAAKLRYETGETGKLEYIAAASEYEQIKVMRAQALADIEIAKRALQQFTGVKKDFKIPKKKFDRLAIVPMEDSISLKNNAALQFSAQQKKASEAEIAVEKAEFLPKLNLAYKVQKVGGQSGFYAYQVGLSMPLWFLPQRSKVKAVQAKSKVAEQNYLEQKAVLQSQSAQLFKALDKTVSTLAYYEDHALSLAEEQLKTAELAIKEGEIDYVTYITLLNSAIKIKQNYIQTLNQYNQQVIELDFLTGKL